MSQTWNINGRPMSLAQVRKWRDEQKAKMEKPSEPEKPSVEDKEERDKLRKEYKEIAGKNPFAGWTAEQLQEKIISFNKENEENS